VAIGIVLINRRVGVVACVAALVMAIARVYAGAHYPGDVLAGLLLGGAVAAVGFLVIVPLISRLVALIADGRGRVLVAQHQPANLIP
jgi:membrane-associated phospholipid phosphatase